MSGSVEGGGHPWRAVPWAVAATMFLLPLVAMRLTDEVAWDGADFAVFGAMLLGACGAWELAARSTGSVAYRAAMGVAVATAFFLVWLNLAVGLVGSEDDPANLMFGGVLALGVLGAVAARFRPRGMARAMVATAFAQVVVGAIALASSPAGADRPGPVAVLTAFLATLWLASACLFARAARERDPAGAAS
jgi:hypothetical protein